MTVNTQQLKQLLADNARVSEAEASAFVDALANVIISHLQKGEEVAIQGIGVFSVVGLRQGETRRVAFIPDEKMKANVNSPFSCFEPVVIGNVKEAAPVAEGVIAKTEQVEESAADAEQQPVSSDAEDEGEAVAVASPDVAAIASAEEGADASADSVAESEDETEPQNPSEAETEAESATPTAEPEATEEPKATAEPEPAPEPSKTEPKTKPAAKPEQKGSGNMAVYVSLGAIAVACLALAFFIFSGPSQSDMKEARKQAKEAVETRTKVEPEATATDTTLVSSSSASAVESSTAASPSVATQTASAPKAQPEKVRTAADYDKMRLKDASGQYVTTQLNPGERLTLLALRHFGDKAFWAYIYDVNADHVKGPNSVEAGKTLYLPDPKYFGIDSADVNSLKRARQRGHDLLKQSAGQ